MPSTLPQYTRTLDDSFVSTWYEIREEAIDNILSATVIWNALMGAGCFTDQVGGEIITRTIGFGRGTAAQRVAKGSVMVPGEPTLDTMAIFNWKYMAGNIQRSAFDDQKNNGPFKIKDYVGRRITAGRDELEQSFETDVIDVFQAAETNRILSLNDMIPPVANRTTGTYGGIQRPGSYIAEPNGVFVPNPADVNPWWGPKYLPGVLATIDTDLLDDLKKLYNALHKNQVAPNLILTTQTIFEIYETFAIDISQIIKDETTRLADLGFEVLRFKGKPVIWADGVSAGTVFMLNTDWIEFVYDPEFWFDMTDCKPGGAFEFDRAAQIVCAGNLISTQLRRHGRLDYT